MSIFQLALLGGGVIAAFFAWGNWRAIGWIVALLIDHAVSVAYWDTGLPYAELVAGLCDASVCLVIYALARAEWEIKVLYRLFQGMVLVNMLYLAGNLDIAPKIDHVVYSSLLEVINVLILLSIGGFGRLERIENRDVVSVPARPSLYRTFVALRERRKKAPFWEV